MLHDEDKPVARNEENPNKLTGADLRHLAFRRGVAKSSLERMTDEQIRLELSYLTRRQYENEMV